MALAALGFKTPQRRPASPDRAQCIHGTLAKHWLAMDHLHFICNARITSALLVVLAVFCP
eukprot:5220034-Pleurochrysis_carterae.AAC.1